MARTVAKIYLIYLDRSSNPSFRASSQFCINSLTSLIMAPSANEVSSSLPPKSKKQLSSNTGISDKLVHVDFEDAKLHDRVLKTFRCLIADLCEQFKGGHPGSAMGMAAIGVALWKYVMEYTPENPHYFNRDRFVLSNGRNQFSTHP